MAKRGQTYPYRVRYVWTRDDGTTTRGTIVASSLDEAELKADRVEAAGHHHDDRNVAIEVLYLAKPGNPGTVISRRTTAQESTP